MNDHPEREIAMLQKLTKSDYLVSSWSGGITTQIAIFPPNANYADRDFLWRISSASVDLDESDFTLLPDYERLISTLEGEIVLTHNGGAPIRLRPFEVHAFSGADATHSTGRCTDFNLMLRRGKVFGSMEILRFSNLPGTIPARSKGEQLLLYCAAGSLQIEDQTNHTGILTKGETMVLSEADPLALIGPATVILCRMSIR